MNPSPVGTQTATAPSQRRTVPPAGTSLNVWIRLPNLNHELPTAEEDSPEVVEVVAPEPVRQTIVAVEPQPEPETAAALERRTLHAPQLALEPRSISPVALLTGIVAATALFCMLLVGGRKASSTSDKAAEKPAAVDSASVAAPKSQADAAQSTDDSTSAQADAKKKKKKKPDASPDEPATDADETVIGVSPWPRKEKSPDSASGPNMTMGDATRTDAAITQTGGQSPTPYPQTTTPWPPQHEAQPPVEYRASRPVAEFEGTIQKPEYRAENDRIRPSLH